MTGTVATCISKPVTTLLIAKPVATMAGMLIYTSSCYSKKVFVFIEMLIEQNVKMLLLEEYI